MNDGRLIPAGFFKGRAIAGSEQYGSNEKTGTDQIAIDLASEELGVTVTTFLYFTENSAQFAVDRLRACGWKGNDLSRLAGLDTNEITIQVSYDTFEGKERMKVEIATAAGRVTLPNQMTQDQRANFAKRMQRFVDGKVGGAAPARGASRGGSDLPYDPNAGVR